MDVKKVLLIMSLMGCSYAFNKTLVRLVNGPEARVGRLEVYHNGQWGTVCDDNFDEQDATVVCRMLGLLDNNPYLFPKQYQGAKYGQGSGQIWLDEVGCVGNESDISECSFYSNTWGATNCGHGEDISVDCRPFWSGIRLVGGSGYSEKGRVEIMFRDPNGVSASGTICDSHFDSNDARVICRMLGYNSSYITPIAYSNSVFGPGSGPVVLSDLSCNGREDSLDMCPSFQWGKIGPLCDHTTDASVNCSVIYGSLSTGMYTKEGRLLITDADSYSSHRVCTDVWNDVEATYICKNLFSSGSYKDVTVIGKAVNTDHFGELLTSGKILKYQRNCRGLPFCINEKSSTESCKYYDIGLVCETSKQNTVRLVGGRNSREGRIEILYNGQMGTLCDYGWDMTDAKPLCRMLGYWSTSPTVYSNAWFGQGNGTSWRINPYCNGFEKSFFDCQQGYYYGYRTCSHSSDAGVNCTLTAIGTDHVRLADGPGPWKGRLDIFYNNKWGSVCWDRWTSRNTAVVCTMLRYINTTGRASAIPSSATPLFLAGLHCAGYETDIGYCTADSDITNCNGQVVEIDCSDDVSIRLANGTTPVDGEVELKINGQWKKVCDNGWNIEEGRVICSMIGLNNTNPNVSVAYNNHSSAVNIGLDCTGWEGHIDQCHRTRPTSCQTGAVATVSCIGCVQVHTSSSGEISSPNYPSYYPPNVDCLYIIDPKNTSTGHHGLFKLNFDSLRIQSGETVDIYSGVQGKPLAHFKGYLYMYTYGVENEYAGNKLLVRFKSDGTNQYYGFHARWSALEIEDVATMVCQPSGWNIRINRLLLEAMYAGFNATAVFLHSPRCTGRIEKDVIVIDYDYAQNECYTRRQMTNMEIIYTSELVYPEVSPSFPSIILGHIWKIDVQCSLPNHGLINIQIHPDETTLATNQVTVRHSLNGTTSGVAMSFHFYSDPGFLHEIRGNPIHASFGEEVYVKVTHDSVDAGLKMRLDTCYSRPGSSNGPTVYLVQDGCAPTSLSHVISQDVHESRFSFKVFEYPDHISYNAYVYCNATFCNINDYSSRCSQGCHHSGRSLHFNQMPSPLRTSAMYSPITTVFKSQKLVFSIRR